MKKTKQKVLHAVFLAVTIAVAALYIYPVFLMVINSMKPFKEVLINVLALPTKPALENFTYVIEKMD